MNSGAARVAAMRRFGECARCDAQSSSRATRRISAIDIAKRTTCAGPLDEHAIEFEVATVKEAIALSQAGPSAEVPPPDPTEAEARSQAVRAPTFRWQPKTVSSRHRHIGPTPF